ncbi:nucleotide pyrophosphohydrolase [Candidatus Bathyarchaeota archaeon]|nr:nucleotide pyrophosphohydrolase [Candidatus Bathyarchaeota archaeon]
MPKNMDENTTVDQLKKAILRFSQERDWLKYHNPKDLAVSISLEAAELLEHFQWLTNEEIEQSLSNTEEFSEIKSEIADVINYALELSNRLGIDVSETVLEKIRDNEKKYPVSSIKGHYKKYDKIS